MTAAARNLPWPKRVDVSLLCFIAMVIAYCDRVNLSVAAPSILKEYQRDPIRGHSASGREDPL